MIVNLNQLIETMYNNLSFNLEYIKMFCFCLMMTFDFMKIICKYVIFQD